MFFISGIPWRFSFCKNYWESTGRSESIDSPVIGISQSKVLRKGTSIYTTAPSYNEVNHRTISLKDFNAYLKSIK
jgi:hypothetical protein